MKKFFSFIILLFITTSVSCQTLSDFKKVDKPSLNTKEIESVKKLSEEILTAQKNGGYYKLTENEATKEMINGLNKTVQKSAYKQVKNLFGDYQGLKFKSLLANKKDPKLSIYRFKGLFESESNVEVRAVLNDKGKLAGFFIKPWKDSL